MEGLRSLEYRGYDSAGVSVASKGGVKVLRSVGKLDNLQKLLTTHDMKGMVGVGHTRWATHGNPTEENAHPHIDCTGQLVVVHNGIIENYLPIKERLQAAGHKFQSETDTEVVAHLIEEKLKGMGAGRAGVRPDMQEPLFFEAVRQALSEVKGAYALVMMWAGSPGTIIAAKTASPLVVGFGKDETFLASDVPAFLSHARDVVFLEDGELAVLSAARRAFFSLDGKKVEKKTQRIAWDRTMAEKGGYKHFMLKEIHEQPQSFEDTFRGRLFPLREGVLQNEVGMPAATLAGISRIHLVACGTAYHACLIGRYLIEEMTGVPCETDIASEFRYRQLKLDPNSLMIAVSQSGETADTLAAVKEARRQVKALAICNSVGSSLSREADYTLYTRCGPEIGVASTKAFTGQLAALYVFALHLAMAKKTYSDAQARQYIDDLLRMPGLLHKALELDGKIQEVAKKIQDKKSVLFIGRHLNYPIALEGALKLKEISYIHAEGYAAGEMKHGPIALIEKGMPVVAIATRSRVSDKVASNIQEAKARGAFVIAVTTAGEKSHKMLADIELPVPPCPELFAPVLAVVPLQLLAYHTAVAKGADVDQPRNLAKSVTVE